MEAPMVSVIALLAMADLFCVRLSRTSVLTAKDVLKERQESA